MRDRDFVGRVQVSAPTDLQADELTEAFEYLDELRESGRTNMFGAAGYVVDELGWARNEAVQATRMWMETFDHDLSVEQRVAKARGQSV